MTLRMMAVHAHPDDESSKGAATYAYYLSRGVSVTVVSCTGGERGSILNDTLEAQSWAQRDLAGLRRSEMQAAQKLVGFSHRWLGYVDSGLPEEGDPLPVNAFAGIPVEVSAAPLVGLIRELKPHVLLTYDENGGYPHPDHIRCHQISVHAYHAAADPQSYPEAGEPWQVSKLYYDRIFNYQRIQAVYETLVESDPEHPLLEKMSELRGWLKDAPASATTRIPAGDFFDLRDQALLAHASQVSPESAFFFWPNHLQKRAWPYEDFQLVDSRVGALSAEEPESDFFTGIDDKS